MSHRKSKRARQDETMRTRWLLHVFMLELRRILRLHSREIKETFPNRQTMCATCAFMPATDSWPGAEATAWGLVQAIRDDQPFYCHEGMEIVDGDYDPTTATHLRLCGGWADTIGDPATKLAFTTAARRVFASTEGARR